MLGLEVSVGKAKMGKTQNNDLDVDSSILKMGYTRKWSKACEGRLTSISGMLS